MSTKACLWSSDDALYGIWPFPLSSVNIQSSQKGHAYNPSKYTQNIHRTCLCDSHLYVWSNTICKNLFRYMKEFGEKKLHNFRTAVNRNQAEILFYCYRYAVNRESIHSSAFTLCFIAAVCQNPESHTLCCDSHTELDAVPFSS